MMAIEMTENARIGYTDAVVVAGLRLAFEAAADAETFRSVAEELLKLAPSSDRSAKAPVHALVEAIQAAGARFELCS